MGLILNYLIFIYINPLMLLMTTRILVVRFVPQGQSLTQRGIAEALAPRRLQTHNKVQSGLQTTVERQRAQKKIPPPQKKMQMRIVTEQQQQPLSQIHTL